MVPAIVMLVTYATYTLLVKQKLTGVSNIANRKSTVTMDVYLASKIFSSLSVFSLLGIQVRRMSFLLGIMIQGMSCLILSLFLSRIAFQPKSH